ncbi:MAG: histidine kinase [Holophaga sp.]|nr:histidine kinase [Holophaga sp.]
MHASELGPATWIRIRRPATWGAVLAFGALWLLTRWGVGNPPSNWQEFTYPFTLAFAYLVLSPVPWQWTGNDQPLTSMARGLTQAMLWNLVWVAGMTILLSLNFSGDRRGPGPSSGGLGRHGSRVEGAERPRYPLVHPRLVAVAIANLSLAMLIGWILADKERAERKESDANRTAAAAQARALQAQMNPHVLFNAISGLTELVREDPRATEDALVSLASLLRSLLESSSKPLGPLSAEKALIEQYLALETIRLGHRLRVVWEWDPELESQELPPLLLQPLVENAIKHGVAPHRGGGELRIFLKTEGHEIRLGVANTGEPLIQGAPEGIGLRNLRERLALLGERPEALHLEREGDWTLAELILRKRNEVQA